MLDATCSGKAETLIPMRTVRGRDCTVAALPGVKRQSELPRNQVVESRRNDVAPSLEGVTEWQDYSGIDRVNCSAYMLDQLQQMKVKRFQASDSWPYNYAQAATPYVASTFPFELMPPYNAPPSWAPAAGTAPGQNCFDWKVPTATGNDNLAFAFWVPVAFDMHDPRGALLANIPNGQIVLQLTVNNALTATSGVDTPYTSATGTCVFNSATSSNVTIYCYSWDPVAVPGVPTDEYVGGLPIPYDDLQLVHEIRSITDPTGMAASTEKIYTMPSGRDYYRVIASVVENGTSIGGHSAAMC